MVNQHSAGWTDKDIAYLNDNVGVVSFDTMARKLRRSPQSVLSKLEKLGISHTKDRTGLITMHELAFHLSVDDKVIKRLIDDKGLPVSRRNFRFGEYNERRGKAKKRLFYYIDIEEFWEWATNNKDELNWYPLEPLTLLPEPDWLDARRKQDYYSWLKRRRAWTPEQDVMLWHYYYAEGMPQKDIAALMERTTSAVEKRLKRLREAKLDVRKAKAKKA